MHPLRLGILSFLIYAPLGAFLPTLMVYLERDLLLNPAQMALIMGTHALAAMVTPLIIGQLADRWFAADRCLSACAFVASGMLLIWSRSADPALLFVISLGYWLFAVPCANLCNTICFTHLPDPRRQFGNVRAGGTLGWISTGLVFGYWLSNPDWLHPVRALIRPESPAIILKDSLQVGSFLFFLLGIYSLTLPHTPPRPEATVRFAPAKALGLLRERSFAVFMICHFGICMTFAFWIQNVSLLLEHLGVPDSRLPWYLAIQQVPEVLGLFALQFILLRFGIRRTLITGLASLTLGLAILAIGQPFALVIASLSLHGTFICCFLITGQVYVNSKASGDIRASVQSLIMFSAGSGMFLGHQLSGQVRELSNGSFPITFGFSVVIGVILTTTLSIGFRPKVVPTPEPEVKEEPETKEPMMLRCPSQVAQARECPMRSQETAVSGDSL